MVLGGKWIVYNLVTVKATCMVPSGNDQHNYGKSQFIVKFIMKNGDFP